MFLRNRASPFPSLRTTVRIFAKAIVLLVIVNIGGLLTGFDLIDTITQINTWWLVGHGRERLAYAGDFENGQLPVASLMATHRLAYTPKAADEYRVIVLGDSGVLGWGLRDEETFSAQLTAHQVRVQGKRLIAYNLAYPEPSIARDTVILDAALRYQPDLILWFTTVLAFDNSLDNDSKIRVFLKINREHLQQMTTAAGLTEWYKMRFPPEAPSWLALHNQDTFAVWLASLSYPFAAPNIDVNQWRIASVPLPAAATLTLDSPGFRQIPNDTWEFLRFSHDLAIKANAQLWLINEPILIMSGQHSDVNYNNMIARALYDRYRAVLADYTRQHQIPYLDLWDALPSTDFTDSCFHITADGYIRVVNRIIDNLDKVTDQTRGESLKFQPEE